MSVGIVQVETGFFHYLAQALDLECASCNCRVVQNASNYLIKVPLTQCIATCVLGSDLAAGFPSACGVKGVRWFT